MKTIWKFGCSSHQGCGGSFTCTVPPVICPLCGGSNIEMISGKLDARYIDFGKEGGIDVFSLPETATAEEMATFRHELIAEITDYLSDQPKSDRYRIDRADGIRGGYFANAAIAVAELF